MADEYHLSSVEEIYYGADNLGEVRTTFTHDQTEITLEFWDDSEESVKLTMLDVAIHANLAIGEEVEATSEETMVQMAMDGTQIARERFGFDEEFVMKDGSEWTDEEIQEFIDGLDKEVGVSESDSEGEAKPKNHSDLLFE